LKSNQVERTVIEFDLEPDSRSIHSPMRIEVDDLSRSAV